MKSELAAKHLDTCEEDDDCSDIEENEEASSSADRTMTNSVSEEYKMKELQDALTKRESQNVFKLRIIMVLVLLLTAASISTVVYLVSNGGESTEFESSFEGAAAKVLEQFETIVHDLGSLGGLATSATTAGMRGDEAWPLVTMDNFHERAASVRFLSGALLLSIAPMVELDLVSVWDEYVQGAQNAWM